MYEIPMISIRNIRIGQAEDAAGGTVVAEAILRAAQSAESAYGYPAMRDLDNAIKEPPCKHGGYAFIASPNTNLLPLV